MKARSITTYHDDLIKIFNLQAQTDRREVNAISKKINAGVTDFEEWLEVRGFFIPGCSDKSLEQQSALCQQMVNPLNKDNPVIVDVGCADCSLYYKLLDFLPKYTYVGIEKSPPTGDSITLLNLLKKKENYIFHFLNADVTQLPPFRQKVDFIFLEDIAVHDADNEETHRLLKYIIEKFIPNVLLESGSFHIKSASSKQETFLIELLTANNIDFICVDELFICGKAALCEEIIAAVEKVATMDDIFNIDKPPYKKQRKQIDQKSDLSVLENKHQPMQEMCLTFSYIYDKLLTGTSKDLPEMKNRWNEIIQNGSQLHRLFKLNRHCLSEAQRTEILTELGKQLGVIIKNSNQLNTLFDLRKERLNENHRMQIAKNLMLYKCEDYIKENPNNSNVVRAVHEAINDGESIDTIIKIINQCKNANLNAGMNLFEATKTIPEKEFISELDELLTKALHVTGVQTKQPSNDPF